MFDRNLPRDHRTDQKTNDKLWSLMDEYIGHDKESIQKQILSKIEYTLAKSRFDFNIQHCCVAIKLSLFDRLIECGNDSNGHFTMKDCKRAYVLSDQGLSSTNKSLKSILVNMNLENAYKEAIEELGYDLNEVYKVDNEFRTMQVKNTNNNYLDNFNPYNHNVYDMAESLIDSLATLELPAWGYGLRYKYGSIKQYKQALKQVYSQPQRKINNFHQDSANKKDFSKNPLEIQRFDFSIKIQMEGRVEQITETQNGLTVARSRWVDSKYVKA